MHPALRVLLLALLLPASCGEPADPASLTTRGEAALGSGEEEVARAAFAAALSSLEGDTSSDLYLRAKLGSIQASCASAPAAAKEELFALANERPHEIDDGHFIGVIDRLVTAGNTAEAGELLEEAKLLFPDTAQLDRLGKRLSEQPGLSNETLQRLQGLGYL